MQHVNKAIDYATQKLSQIKSQSGVVIKSLWGNHRKKTIVGSIILVIIIISIINGTRKPIEGLKTVQTGNVVDQVVLSGRTESLNSVDLGFADSGRVDRVFVTEGQVVKKGQVLAELEMGDLRAQLTNARAGLTIALANANQVQTNLEKVTREQDALVESAQRALFGTLEAYPDDTFSNLVPPIIVGSYQGSVSGEYVLQVYGSSANTGASVRYSGLEEGVVPLTVGSRTALGTRGLYIQFPDSVGYVNSEWIIPVPNNRSTGYAGLFANYQTALATRDRVIASARAELSGELQSVQQARIDQARASVNQILSAMERRRIIAPFSGTISQVALKEGESTIGISKDTSPGVSMLATDQYKVVIKIPEIDVARVAPNVPVEIILDAYGTGETFKGLLTTINPAETIVDGVPVYEGTVLFTEPDDRIRSGMTATVTIIIGQKENVVTVPGNYIREDKVKRKFYVIVVDEQGKSEEREVTAGIRGSDGSTEIISGLTAGEQIALPIQ